MPPIDGTAHNSSDPLARVNGAGYNSAKRLYRNSFNLADDGGGTDPLIAAKVREGCVLDTITMESDANLSAIDFTIGTEDEPAKYGAAQAGPNAGKVEFLMPIAMAAGDELAAPEDIILTPSANLPSVGTIVTKVSVSKR